MIEDLTAKDFAMVSGGLTAYDVDTGESADLQMEGYGAGASIEMLVAEAEYRDYKSEGYSVTFWDVMAAVNGNNSLLPAALR